MPSVSHAQLDALDAEIKALRPREAADRHGSDPVAFARLVGLELDPWQRRVVTGDHQRVALLTSRQAGKSTTAALLALHQALYNPGSLTLLISPSLRQSSELFRSVVKMRQALPWPVSLTEDNRLSMTVRGGGRIVSLPSTESTIRGYAAVSLLIEDEAARVPDELFYATQPMLAVSQGRQLLLSTAWSTRGHFHTIWETGEGWHRERVTVFDVPRISPEWIEQQRKSMPRAWFAAEYECTFNEPEDAVFSDADIEAALDWSVEPLFGGTR